MDVAGLIQAVRGMLILLGVAAGIEDIMHVPCLPSSEAHVCPDYSKRLGAKR
jgi:hypothetical protein